MYQIHISGQVQGVGFRPHVYRLATQLGYCGEVYNDWQGVVIILQANQMQTKTFVNTLVTSPPVSAIIDSYTYEKITQGGERFYASFSIRQSKESKVLNLPLTPDFAICNSCKSDLDEDINRRYRYPFTTCVDCGPRYAITERFPFERHHTTLKEVRMCNLCEQEYKNSWSRRFHSQTNTCPNCGFHLNYTSSTKTLKNNTHYIINQVVTDLKKGLIVAVKSTNGYLLCCDAALPDVIYKLRDRKKRLHKPFALLYPNIEMIEKHYHLSVSERKELCSSAAPIVLVENKVNLASQIAIEAIAPGLSQTGVMLPNSALLYLLMTYIDKPIIATSANLYGSPIIYTQEKSQEVLANIADAFVHHNLSISYPQDDSVVKYTGKQKMILRRSRGYAPNYLSRVLPHPKKILAMGGMLKSTFCLAPNERLYISPYFGNLSYYEVYQRYQQTINRYLTLFNVKPELILADHHPQYPSTILAESLSHKWSIPLYKIQHHEAHLMSVIGEHELHDSKTKILGFTWDGAGLGQDGTIWGGEVFMYHKTNLERIGHFETFDWIASDKMATTPALSLLSTLMEENRDIVKDRFSPTEYTLYCQVLKTNTLKTSSVGRIFDAVASLLGLLEVITYEGQAAMLVEECARLATSPPIDYLPDLNWGLPTRLLIEILCSEYKHTKDKAQIALNFIYTLAKRIIRIAEYLQINTVVCTGGVFQNGLLVHFLQNMSRKNKLCIKFNCKFASNDENVSIGQYFHHLYMT